MAAAAAVASVAVVAVAEVAAAAEVAVGATAAVVIAFTPSDLMRFRLRYLNFLEYIFHYNLEIIFRYSNNSFLKATFLHKRHLEFRNNKRPYTNA